MSQAVAFPLVAVQLVADRHAAVAALLLRLFDSEPQAVAVLCGEDELFQLARLIPCLVSPEYADSPAVLALRAAGGQVVAGEPAGDIDSWQRFAQLAESGAEWFSGTWYLQPQRRHNAAEAASRALMLRLLKLLAEDAETEELEALIKQDPRLSYQLLRLVNSVAMGLPRKIGSFRQAIVILGRRQLRRWLHLLMFAPGQGEGRLSPLLAAALRRARLLELAAGALGESVDGQDEAFIAGMFSLLHAVFDMPLEQVLQPLHLADDVVAALLRGQGRLGALLRLAAASEGGDGTALAAALAACGLSRQSFALCQFKACRWMLETSLEVDRG